jgi:trigger factor
VSDRKTLEELKTQIRSDLTGQAEREADRAFQREIMVRLAERHPFDIPQKLIDRNAERIAHNMEHTLQHGGIRLPESGEGRQKFVESLRRNAVDSIREEVFIQSISEKEGIRVGPEETDAEIAAYAEKMGESPEVLRKRLDKEGATGRISRDLLIKKTYDFIRSKVKIKEERVSPAEKAGETGSDG